MGGITAIDWKLLGAILAFLFVFNIIFNYFVTWLGERSEGYVWVLVIFGVLFTLIMEAFISLEAAVLTLIFFAVAGTPMAVGDMARHIKAREAAKRRMRKEANDST